MFLFRPAFTGMRAIVARAHSQEKSRFQEPSALSGGEIFIDNPSRARYIGVPVERTLFTSRYSQDYTMAIEKTPQADIRAKTRRYFEISLIIALLIVTAAFRITSYNVCYTKLLRLQIERRRKRMTVHARRMTQK